MKKGALVFTLVVFLVAMAGFYYYLQQESFSTNYVSGVENTPSSDTPAYTKLFAGGLYEVRSFAGNNPLCGYEEVVEVGTNKMIYSSQMCEANIVDIQARKDQVTIIKNSMMGEEKVVVSK